MPAPPLRGGWARGAPGALTLTALAPQLFRDLVVRSFCVSRFTVNKKAQCTRFTVNKKAQYRGEPVALTLTALAPQLFRDLVVRSPCVSFHC